MAYDQNKPTYKDWLPKMANGLFRSRSKTRSDNNLGIVDLTGSQADSRFRDAKLEKFDSYYENRQYDHLAPWDKDVDAAGEYVKIRNRRPRFRIAYSKTLSQRLASRLVGGSSFPNFNIVDSPDDQEFVRAVIEETRLSSAVLEVVRRGLNTGSSFFRFYLENGAIRKERYDSKICYPVFDSGGELELVTIKYVYEDMNDKDSRGNPKKKWYRVDLGKNEEILYDNPPYHPENPNPEFVEVSRVEHGLGFVQGEWYRTCEDSVDGYGLVADIMDFIDELCYSTSQSSQAVSYNQDPQVYFKGLDEEEAAQMVRSASKSWMLGLKGEVGALETNLDGVTRAMELRDKMKHGIEDISRVLLLDPEKIIGSAQSAKAMEILYGPLKDLVDELRPSTEDFLISCALKMSIIILAANKRGMDVPLEIPPSYSPQTLAIDLEWHPLFQQTMEDLDKKVTVTSKATAANLISRETGTRYIAKDFGIESVEEELQKIASQPILNPFGTF